MAVSPRRERHFQVLLALVGHCWSCVVACLGVMLGPFWLMLRPMSPYVGAMLGLGCPMLGPGRGMLVAYVGPMSDPSMLRPSWPMLWPCWQLSQNIAFSKKAVSSRRERHFEVMFALLGAMMPPCWDYIGLYWDQVGLCWPMLEPFWAMLVPRGAPSWLRDLILTWFWPPEGPPGACAPKAGGFALWKNPRAPHVGLWMSTFSLAGLSWALFRA